MVWVRVFVWLGTKWSRYTAFRWADGGGLLYRGWFNWWWKWRNRIPNVFTGDDWGHILYLLYSQCLCQRECDLIINILLFVGACAYPFAAAYCEPVEITDEQSHAQSRHRKPVKVAYRHSDEKRESPSLSNVVWFIAFSRCTNLVTSSLIRFDHHSPARPRVLQRTVRR